MTPERLISLYVIALGGGLALLALYDAYRQRSFHPARDPYRVFRCGDCGLVYTDDPEVERSRCPQCGRTNDSYRF